MKHFLFLDKDYEINPQYKVIKNKKNVNKITITETKI